MSGPEGEFYIERAERMSGGMSRNRNSAKLAGTCRRCRNDDSSPQASSSCLPLNFLFPPRIAPMSLYLCANARCTYPPRILPSDAFSTLAEFSLGNLHVLRRLRMFCGSDSTVLLNLALLFPQLQKLTCMRWILADEKKDS